MAVFILVQVAAGIIMARTYADPDPWRAAWHHATSNLHHTLGLLLLILAAVRSIWRLATLRPPHPASLTAIERRAATVSHIFLYGMMLLLPVTGWAALSSLAGSERFGPTILWLFGTNGFDTIVPRLLPPVPWTSDELLRYGNVALAHRWLFYAGSCIVTLHVAAALRHHFLLGDGTLLRMLGKRAPPDG